MNCGRKWIFLFVVKAVKFCLTGLGSCVLQDKLLPPDFTVVFALLCRTLDLSCRVSVGAVAMAGAVL